MPNEEHPTVRLSYSVDTADVDLHYEHLEKELGERFQKATIRWSLAQLEERLRHGRIPSGLTKETQKLALTLADLELLKQMAGEKTCEYQVASGRELYCSAAAQNDEKIAGSLGLKRLAPTSRPMCAACTLPDTDFACSHLAHPQVFGLSGSGFNARQLVGAYCEIGRSEIDQDASGCRPGGHACWNRVVEPLSVASPAVVFSPLELPIALDFLSVIWKQVFGAPLIHLKSIEKTTAIALPCATPEEFRARLGDLYELFKLMDISEELLPADKQGKIDKAQTFNRMEACLSNNITDEADRERAFDAIGTLRAMTTARNKLTHGGSELAVALERLGVDYPIADHARAWDQVRSKIAEALTAIRSALQAAAG